MRTETLGDSGSAELEALAGGYHVAFLVGAIFAAAAAVLGAGFLRPKPMPAPAHQAEFEPATEAA